MLNLSLIRHAKSDWPTKYNCNDFDRKISDTGIKKTQKICNFLNLNNFKFEEVLCSPAIRTKQTLEIINNNLQIKPKIKFLDKLYHNSDTDIFDTLMLEASHKNVLIVSHEPLLSSSLMNFFLNIKNKHLDAAISSYPTSGFFNSIFKCDAWTEINKDNCKINFFVKPKDFID